MISKITIFALLCSSIALVKTADEEESTEYYVATDKYEQSDCEENSNCDYRIKNVKVIIENLVNQTEALPSKIKAEVEAAFVEKEKTLRNEEANLTKNIEELTDKRMKKVEAEIQKQNESLPSKIRTEVEAAFVEKEKTLNNEIANLKKNISELMKLKKLESVQQTKIVERIDGLDAAGKNIKTESKPSDFDKRFSDMLREFTIFKNSLTLSLKSVENREIENAARLSKLESIIKQTPENDDGYVKTPSIGSHKIYTVGKNYEEARAVCENDGAHLAVVDSPAEIKLLAEMVRKAQSKITNVNQMFRDQAYIGVYFDDETQLWVNAFGVHLIDLNWAQSYNNQRQPNGGRYQKCVTTIANDGGEWNDIDCRTRLAFICEKNAEPSLWGNFKF